MDLLDKGRCLDKGYHVFIDNFYTKLPLARELLKRKTFLTGTINNNSKGLPKSLVTASFTVGEPVNYRQGQILVVGFKQKPTRKPVFLMSTACEGNSTLVRNSRGRVSVKPVAIQRYNQIMGGVDCKDKSLYHISCSRTAKKYWKKLFYNLLDTCVQNAYVLHTQQSVGLGGVMTRAKFLLALVHSLTTLNEPSEHQTPTTPIGDEHYLTLIPKRGRKLCPVCHKKANHWCPGCNCGVHQVCFEKIDHWYRPK